MAEIKQGVAANFTFYNEKKMDQNFDRNSSYNLIFTRIGCGGELNQERFL